MKYMMLVIADPEAAAEAEPRAEDWTIEQWLDDVARRGKRIIVANLNPTSTAPPLPDNRGQLLVSDGPFVESGMDLWFRHPQCDDLDEAIAIAARHPQANGGKLELRPFWTDEV
jgi:hypothetical protein